MDSGESQNSSSKGPKIFFWGVVVLVIAVVGYILGSEYLTEQSSQLTQTENREIANEGQNTPTQSEFPIDPSLEIVDEMKVVYTLSGRVQDIVPTEREGRQFYLMRLFDYRGEVLGNEFLVSDEISNVVFLEEDMSETPASVEDIEKDDLVRVDYFVDVKGGDDGQVTKIILEKL